MVFKIFVLALLVGVVGATAAMQNASWESQWSNNIVGGQRDLNYPDWVLNPRPPCVQEGVFPHPRSHNCTWYYRCVARVGVPRFSTFYFQCEPGTIFEDDLDQCVHPHSGYNCQGDCRGQSVQHKEYCNVYYKCDNAGDKFLCPEGSVFDTVRQMCRIQEADENLCAGKSIYSLNGFRYGTDRVSLGSLGTIPVGQQSFPSVMSTQQYLQVPTPPQFQPNYLAYFNPQHPLRRNPQQVAPLQYVQPFTTRFTQNALPHPEPENAHPRQYFHVVDGDNSQ